MVLNLPPKLLIDRKFRSDQKQSLDFVNNIQIFCKLFLELCTRYVYHYKILLFVKFVTALLRINSLKLIVRLGVKTY